MTTTRYEVRLVVWRTLYRVLEARDPQAAEDIAMFLFHDQRSRAFLDEGEDLVDCQITPIEEAAS